MPARTTRRSYCNRRGRSWPVDDVRDDSPDGDIGVGVYRDRRVGVVLRAEASASPDDLQPLDRELAVDDGDHDVARAWRERAVHDQQITGEDAGELHRVAVRTDEERSRRVF